MALPQEILWVFLYVPEYLNTGKRARLGHSQDVRDGSPRAEFRCRDLARVSQKLTRIVQIKC